jgi:hypothetical protein
MHGLCRTYHWLRNHFGDTQWYFYVTWVKWRLVSVHLETVLISTQDTCTVCTDVPYACKLFWAHPIELLGDVGQVEAHFGLFGDSVNLSVR